MKLERANVRYGALEVLKDFSLSLPRTGRIALMGPSGCGKSTLLRVLGGLIPQPQGVRVGAEDRRIGFLFQEDRLLPWFTARQNVQAVCADAKDGTAERALEAAGLVQSAWEKIPGELSGGMRQRVALARLFAYGADVWLLDEPFQGLDAQSRTQIIEQLIAHAEGKLLLLVTHERAEAEQLCERILQVQGPPLTLLHPAGGCM